MKFCIRCVAMFFVFLIPFSEVVAQTESVQWPDLNQQTKPWTRWWWMGSSVDEANLTRLLEQYHDVGLGGVEITPIYGVAGHENQFVDYLSEDWVDLLSHTLKEAERLGLGVDMATGTGWPFGGPHVEASDASAYITYKTYMLTGGQRLAESIAYEQEPILRVVGHSAMINPERAESVPTSITQVKDPIQNNTDLQLFALDQVRFPKPIPLHVLMAYSEAGDVLDLTGNVDNDGTLDWIAPEGNWTLYAVFQGIHGKMVERAAPGGEGYAINHFSEEALTNYLKPFNEAFAGQDISALRGFFNDSYEVDDANGEADWTPAFFEAFASRRGYDLRQHLPALFGKDDEEINRRVLTDYRQTLSELLLDEFTKPWTTWAHEKGAVTRNQAHGSPANILDLYAASDIPETESTDMMRIKFASSASHVTGKQLTAAEAATWLNEHFQSNWADVKRALDLFFLGGVNHIVYHGTAYSPEGAAWPGWLFYAAVHFSPQNPLWEDLSTLNEYVSRTQAILQANAPANDVLLYLPVLDRFGQRDPSLLVHFHGLDPFEGMTVHEDAVLMQEHGYAFDFISDMQLQQAVLKDRAIQAGQNMYKTVVVPAANHVPLATLEKLIVLAEGGASIIFHEQLPGGVPGLGNLENREAALKNVLGQLQFGVTEIRGVLSARVGEGQVLLGNDLEGLFVQAGVERESFVDRGLEYIRRSRPDGVDYFLTNWGEESIDDWIPINADMRAAAIFDPMTGKRGIAAARNRDGVQSEVYMQMAPGETLILRTYDNEVTGADYPYFMATAAALPVAGTWNVQFVEGGPTVPANTTLNELVSWTDFAGSPGRSFAGTATYSISFPKPSEPADAFVLDLGEVHETARVRLNTNHLTTLIGPTYRVMIDASMMQENNVLEIDVSSLMANRIAEMDRQGMPWKRFYNINVSARLPENRNSSGVFDASGWQPMDSGLIGPVTLTPVKRYTP